MGFRIKDMTKTTYPCPGRFQDTLAVYIDDKQMNPEQCLGGLRLCEPEEPWHSYLFACARDISSNQFTRAQLDIYLIGIRGVSVKFMYLANEDDMFWHAAQQREIVSATYEGCARNGLQRIDEIIYFMDWKNLTSAKAVEDAYTKLEMARHSEEVNMAMVLSPHYHNAQVRSEQPHPAEIDFTPCVPIEATRSTVT